jgi:ornithine decarboxylase
MQAKPFVCIGRYFACSTHTIVVNVISKRFQKEEGSGEATEEPSYMYYLNDGVYGCFNCVLCDHYIPTPVLLKVSI